MMKDIIRFLMLAVVFTLNVVTSHAKSLATASSHSFDHVEIDYAHDECSFKYSPIDFCDERHILEIKNAIAKNVANFNGHYILLKIKEWRPSEYYGDSIVVIDTQTGIVYPMPFDYFSGAVDMRNSKIIRGPKLAFSANSGRVCIDGSILVYRATTNGHFCFYFDGDKFSGYHTEYMN